MFTTCPQCALNLALTVADLRLGQGYVRCGRCTNVFNALLALSEEGDGSSPQPATPVTAPPSPAAAAPGHPAPLEEPAEETSPQSLLDAANSATAAQHRPAGEPHDPAAPTRSASPDQPGLHGEELDETAQEGLEPRAGGGTAGGIDLADEDEDFDPNEATGEVEALRTGTFETIVLEGDDILQTEETVAESEVDAQLQALVQRFDAVRESEEGNRNALWPPGEESGEPEFDLADEEEHPPLSAAQRKEFELDDAGEPDPLQQRHNAAPPMPPQDTEGGEPGGLDALGEPGLPAAQESRQRVRWIAGSLVLALALAGQLVHHFREALVAVPGLATPLTTLYRQFHVELAPRWDLQAYDVRQLGAISVPGETPHIAVRASVGNRATFSQPAPLLRVVLQDRFGNPIATREIAPLEYLHNPQQPQLGADQRVDAELLLPDPGQADLSFEIDACLRGASGRLRCASDPAAH